MPDRVEVTEDVLIDLYDQQSSTWQTVLAKRIYDSLVASDAFRVNYVRQPSRVFAELWSGNDEVCRAVVGTGQYGGRNVSGMWICKRRGSQDQDWSASRKADFEDRFGFRAVAGLALIEWCVDNPGRVEELVRWLIAQAVGEERAEEMSINIDTTPSAESQ